MSKRQPPKKAVRPAARPSTALVRAEPPAGGSHDMAILERIAKDPLVDVGKLERIIEMQKDIRRVQAKSAFDAAFAQMQPLLPTITKRGAIKSKDGTVRSRYARLEDIQRETRPILKQFGFSVRHRTEWPSEKPGVIRIVGILAHEGGHAEESAFESPSDPSDYRTAIQSMGSTVSYGRRYTTMDLLGVTVAGQDNDGAAVTNRAKTTTAPYITVNGDERITSLRVVDGQKVAGQRERLWVIVKKSARSETEVKMWLKARYGVDSTTDIKRKDYEAICSAVEAPGALPMPEEREAGEEG